MDTADKLKERIDKVIKEIRPAIEQLLDKSDLGTLRIDVQQTLEEIDDLEQEYKQTFGSEQPPKP